MSTMISSQGMAFATAMAVSGTVILLAIRLQKSLPPTTTAAQFSLHQTPSPTTTTTLRSCISSDGKKIKKKKKRVHFAKDVMDSCGNGEEFRRQHLQLQQHQSKEEVRNGGTSKNRGMPANRAALYNGILRDRVNHRLAYSC